MITDLTFHLLISLAPIDSLRPDRYAISAKTWDDSFDDKVRAYFICVAVCISRCRPCRRRPSVLAAGIVDNRRNGRARSAAMTFNRIIDRDIDAANPTDGEPRTPERKAQCRIRVVIFPRVGRIVLSCVIHAELADTCSVAGSLDQRSRLFIRKAFYRIRSSAARLGPCDLTDRRVDRGPRRHRFGGAAAAFAFCPDVDGGLRCPLRLPGLRVR